MTQLYVPFAGKKPVEVKVNGHRFVFVAHEREGLEDCLDEIGGDSVHAVETNEFISVEEMATELSRAASDAQVVVVPPEVTLDAMMKVLEKDLPWIH